MEEKVGIAEIIENCVASKEPINFCCEDCLVNLNPRNNEANLIRRQDLAEVYGVDEANAHIVKCQVDSEDLYESRELLYLDVWISSDPDSKEIMKRMQVMAFYLGKQIEINHQISGESGSMLKLYQGREVYELPPSSYGFCMTAQKQIKEVKITEDPDHFAQTITLVPWDIDSIGSNTTNLELSNYVQSWIDRNKTIRLYNDESKEKWLQDKVTSTYVDEMKKGICHILYLKDGVPNLFSFHSDPPNSTANVLYIDSQERMSTKFYITVKPNGVKISSEQDQRVLWGG